MRLAGKVVLISGGASGIGAQTARRFAAEGAKLVLLDPAGDRVEQVAAEVGGRAVVGDAADDVCANDAVSTAVETYGRLDAVVACAGTSSRGTLHEMSPDVWNASIRNNLDSAVSTVRAAVPALLNAGGGSIVLMSSVGGLTSGPRIAAYSTAKSALLGLMRSLTVDYGPSGLRANVVCPGWVLTPMSEPQVRRWADQQEITFEQALSRITRVVPLRRAAAAAEVAAATLFLVSDDASYVSGTILLVDGGQSVVNVGELAFL